MSGSGARSRRRAALFFALARPLLAAAMANAGVAPLQAPIEVGRSGEAAAPHLARARAGSPEPSGRR